MRIISKILLLSAAGILGILPAAAQKQQNPAAGESKNSFQEFRKGLLSDFKDFRERLLEQYEDFLNGEWHEYESLKGEVRDKTPKPKSAPTVKPTPADKHAPYVKPSPAEKPKPTLVPEETKPDKKTDIPRVPDADKGVPAGKKPGKGTAATPGADEEMDRFDFYGLPVAVPKVDYNIRHKLTSTKDYGGNWSDLKKGKIAQNVVPTLKEVADGMNLNDYLMFRLAESYVNHKFPDADASSRFSLLHYLLSNSGYDVRIAVTSSGKPLLLIPFKERVYARTYMNIDGERYYAFLADDAAMESIAGETIMTCALPSDAYRGEKFGLKLSALNIPEKPKPFKLEYGPLSLTGKVNENLMPILYHYPQMPVEDFALSEVSPELRKSLAGQVRTQLAGVNGDEKVEALLKFMHNVFEYATDEENHGFEKPYFMEETLYYAKNDCEDRAIFYTWLLWNALDREAQLITFPGHESATVVLENPVEGTSYKFDGKTYYVSDPTYIGSRTGMVMPNYRGLSPEVDYTFRR